MRLHRLIVPFAVVALAVLASAAPAGATVVTWIEGDNVWIANADGTQKRQLTSEGTADTAFRSPTVDDNGVVVAARDQSYYRIDQSGKVVSANLAPMGPCGAGKPFPHPIRVDSTGEWVSYQYLCNTGYPNFNAVTSVAISPAQQAYATGNQIDWDYWYFPTWYGKRLVVSDSQKIFIQPANSDPPPPASPSFGWAWLVPPDASPNYVRYTRATVNRAGTMVLIEGSVHDSSGNLTQDFLALAQLANGVPAEAPQTPASSAIANDCRIATQGDAIFSDFSPDGNLITFADDGGVKVMPLPAIDSAADCRATGPTTVVSASGKMPSLGAGTVAAATEGGTGTGGDGTGTGGGPPATCPTGAAPACSSPDVAGPQVSILVRKGSLRALTGRGLAVPVSCSEACNVDLSLTLPARTAKRLRMSAARTVVIARGKRSSAAAGQVKVVLRPTARAKKRLRKLRRLKATLKLVATDAAGNKTTAARAIALRR